VKRPRAARRIRFAQESLDLLSVLELDRADAERRGIPSTKLPNPSAESSQTSTSIAVPFSSRNMPGRGGVNPASAYKR
jgi:hypothetical protein